MGRTVCTDPQCLCMGLVYLYLYLTFREVIGVCSEKGTKYINELCGKLRLFEYTKRLYI
jgi:hypothetical protein